MPKAEGIMQIVMEKAVKKLRRPEEKESGERLLRDVGEDKLVRFCDIPSRIRERTPEVLLHELQAQQVELEMQNEELRRVQITLEESRQRFSDLYDFAPVGYFTFTREGLIKEVNLTGATLLKMDRPTLINKRFSPFIAPSDLDLWDQYFLKGLKQREKETCDLVLKRQDGSTFQAGLESIRMEVNRGVFEVHTTVTDITDRKRAEEALWESEEKYRRLVKLLPDGIVVHRGGYVIFANPASARIIGALDPAELIGKAVIEFVHPDYRKFALKRIKQSQDEGIQAPLEEEKFIRLDGRTIDVEVIAIPFCSEDKQEILTIFNEISERKRTEEVLQKNEERLRDVIFSTADWVWEVDENGVYTYSSQKGFDLLGESNRDIIGKTPFDFMPPDEAKRVGSIFSEIVTNKAPIKDLENWSIRRDGNRICLLTNGVPILDEEGKLKGYRGVDKDITDRKRSEELLLKSKKKYRELADSISDIFFAMDKNLRYTFWNKASEKLTGIPAEKALGKTLMELFPDNEPRRQLKEIYLRVIETNKPQYLTVDYPGDEGIVHEISAYPIVEGVSVFVKDITKRRLAEEKLKNTLGSLRKAFRTIIQVMVTVVETKDPYTAGHQTRTADLSRAIATEMGLSQDKIEGLRMAGSIHDVGKLSIPAEILSKPTKLSELEFSLIKEHPQKGYDILKNVESPWPLAEMVYQHHERMDGSGYPRGLKGDEILIEARILAVADVVEAMASYRPYRPALGIDKALEEISQNKGILYDPEVVEVCLKLFREKGFGFE